MSTRCQISITKEDNTILSCYCHYDGYVHGGVGEDLFNNYNSPELALKAVKTCCNSMTEEELEATDLYTYNNITELEDWIVNTDREYLYLWKNDNWYVLPVKWKRVNRNWVLLSEALKDENFDKQSCYD